MLVFMLLIHGLACLTIYRQNQQIRYCASISEHFLCLYLISLSPHNHCHLLRQTIALFQIVAYKSAVSHIYNIPCMFEYMYIILYFAVVSVPASQGIVIVSVPASQGIVIVSVPASQGIVIVSVPASQGIVIVSVPASQGIVIVSVPASQGIVIVIVSVPASQGIVIVSVPASQGIRARVSG